MANSERVQILSGIKTRLESITTNNGYNNTLKDVRRSFVDYGSVSDFPICCLINGRSPYVPMTAEQYTSGNAIVGTDGWMIGVVGYCKADLGEDNMLIAMENLVEDILKAMLEDHTLGLSFVRNVYLIDVNPVVDIDQSVGIVMINFAVKYDFSKSNP